MKKPPKLSIVAQSRQPLESDPIDLGPGISLDQFLKELEDLAKESDATFDREAACEQWAIETGEQLLTQIGDKEDLVRIIKTLSLENGALRDTLGTCERYVAYRYSTRPIIVSHSIGCRCEKCVWASFEQIIAIRGWKGGK